MPNYGTSFLSFFWCFGGNQLDRFMLSLIPSKNTVLYITRSRSSHENKIALSSFYHKKYI